MEGGGLWRDSKQLMLQLSMLLLLTAQTVNSSCYLHSAKWKQGGPRVTQPSKSDPSKVMVDWSTIIENARCADKYVVWVWPDGKKKADGKKYTVTDKNSHTKVVDVVPCVYTNIRVELDDDTKDEKNKKDSDTTKYNSAALPSFDSAQMKSQFKVGFYQDRSGNYDLTKASIKFNKNILTFPQCIKHIEVSGKPVSGAAGLAAKSKTTSNTIKPPVAAGRSIASAVVLPGSWQPFGTGRQVSQLGAQPVRAWGWDGFNPGHSSGGSGFNPGQSGGSGFNPGSSVGSGSGYNPGSSATTARPALSGNTTPQWGFNPAGRPPTDRPGGGWSYSTTSRPSFAATATTTSRPPLQGGSTGTGFNPGGTSYHLAPTAFTNQFLRMSRPPAGLTAAGPVKSTPPFTADEVEMVVTVKPCQIYDFDVSIVSPTGAVIGKIDSLRLPALADIPEYVPPPLTSVMSVDNIGGGKQTVGAQRGSPVPEECLVDYLEAVDAYAHRLENVANQKQNIINNDKRIQTAEEIKVEVTQAETLQKFGCNCASPRLELIFDTTAMTASYDTIKSKYKSPVFGVYLYDGMHNGRPYYRLDLEQRSSKEFAAGVRPAATVTSASGQRRSKRFIGRVDGGPTTTTRLPWNYGAAGGSWGHTTVHYPTFNWGLTTTTSRYHGAGGGSGGSNWHAGTTPPTTARYSGGGFTTPSTHKSGSSGRHGTTVNIPIIRETTTVRPLTPVKALVPRYIFWDSTKKQWLISTQVGGSDSAAEFGSGVNTKSKCPADLTTEVWQTRSGSLRSGSGRWVEEPAVKLKCAPLY